MYSQPLHRALCVALLVSTGGSAAFALTAPLPLASLRGVPVRQDAGDDTPPEPDPIERLEAWPGVAKKSELKKEVAKLRKANTEQMGEDAHDQLKSVGAAAAPALIAILGKAKDPADQQRIVKTLDAITDAPHTRLLAAEFAHKSAVVREWALTRVAAFPDEGCRAAALAAFAEANKKGSKRTKSERLAAALCATSTGAADAVPHLIEVAAEDWKRHGAALRGALEAVRGPAASKHAFAALASTERKVRLAGLHVLAGCGTKADAGRLKPYLDETDNGLRVAAINALRGMVDGDAPIARLSAFEAIERSEAWKGRL